MASHSYSFEDVNMMINGPYGNFIVTGYADEGITVAYEGSHNTMTMGAGGEGMHSLHAARNGTITVRLLKTSAFNATLNKMFLQNSTSSLYWGQDQLVVSDPIRGDLWNGTQCAMRKHADNAYAVVGNLLEWAWDVIYLAPVLGSGAPITTIGGQ